MKELSEIEINLDSVQEGLKLWISSKRDGTLFDGIETAIENNEARFQLIEGCYYDYESDYCCCYEYDDDCFCGMDDDDS